MPHVFARMPLSGLCPSCVARWFALKAHTAIKNSSASHKEADARILKAQQQLNEEQQRSHKAREERAALEARFAEEVLS